MVKPVPIVNEHYLKHVERGDCPKTEGKTWCSGKANHNGDCWCLYAEPGKKGLKRRMMPNAKDPRKGL